MPDDEWEKLLAELPQPEPRKPPPEGPGEIALESLRVNLVLASQAALHVARRMVLQPLPDSVRFVLEVGGGTGVKVENGDRRIELGVVDDPQPIENALSWLWYDGHAPMWVNVSARRVDEDHTYLGLLRSPGFLARPARLYHKEEGYPPFHATGLVAPPNWESVEKNGRFKLGWIYDK